MSKVAVASTDGVSINEHFGRTKVFLIYEVEEGGSFKLLEHRLNKPLCTGGHNDKTVDRTVDLLADVDIVLVNQIGPGAGRALQSKGIIPFVLSGPIDKALQAYAKRGKLLKGAIPGIAGSCRPAGDQSSCGCSKGCLQK